MADILIRAEGVSVLFYGQAALSAIDLTIREREHLVFSGENGAGKSTLMRLLRGEVYPSRGSVAWKTPEGMNNSPLSGRAMTALVSARQMEQYSRSAWKITGEEVLLSGLSDTPLVYTEATDAERAQVAHMARLFDIEPLLEHELARLSQGQLSILLLARACMRKPDVLLLDEFTNALDSQTRRRALGILEMLTEQCTLVLATHRSNILPGGIQREVALEKGRIVYDGQRRQNGARENGASAALPGQTRAEQPQAPPLIDIRAATIYLDRAPVLHDITWAIRPGENWAVLGENGAGKSTLLRLAAGEEYPAAGGSVFRHDLKGTPVLDQETLRKGVRLLSDALQANYAYNLPGLALVLSGFEASIGTYRDYSASEIGEARASIRLVSGGAGGLAGAPDAPDAPGAPGAPNTAESLENRPIRDLSTGELRRLLLARALVGSPYLLLLDEPFSGLDEATRRYMLRLLEEIAARGTQLVIVSHHEADLPGCITHVARLAAGRIVEAGAVRGE